MPPAAQLTSTEISSGQSGSIHQRAMGGSSLESLERTDWLLLLTVAAFAAVVRATFFTGFFGSDEVTYVGSALAAADNVWPNSSYIGSIRLGVNYPIAAFLLLFGHSEVAASLWGFACSVLEVAAVFWFARRVGTRELALAASLLMAVLPLHVHLAGRIMADSPLALFITLTFILFYEAEQAREKSLFVLAGVCAGFVFWIKEGTTIFVAAFALWALYRRRFNPYWILSVGSMTIVVAANFAMMLLLSGNPLHLIDSIRMSLRGSTVDTTAALRLENATPGFYFRYLFLNIWHTWLLGPLAAIGFVAACLRWRQESIMASAIPYVLIWVVGLLTIFSLFVFSISPLRLIPKQTNYMTIFFAPLSLLGGMAIVQLRSVVLRQLVLGIYVLGAVFLCALEQQTIHTFTSNSRAALDVAAANPLRLVYVVTNAERLNAWRQMLPGGGGTEYRDNVRPLADLLLKQGGSTSSVGLPDYRGDVLAVVDEQTLYWGNNGLQSVRDVPPCWQYIETLRPVVLDTVGIRLISAAQAFAATMPGTPFQSVSSKLKQIVSPGTAGLYRVPSQCHL